MSLSARRAAAALACALLCACAHAACNVSGVDINFGPYDPLASADGTSTGSITVICDQSPAPTVTIQIGPSGTNSSFNPRAMRRSGGSDLLLYNLYTDAANRSIWGDGSTPGATSLSNRVQKNQPWSPTVYARVPAGQDVSVGSYSDALSITIQF